MKILVAGANGYIGSKLFTQFEQMFSITSLDYSQGLIENNFIQLDLNDVGQVNHFAENHTYFDALIYLVGLALIYKVDRRTKENTEGAMNSLLGSISDQVHTMTSDNGKEFGNHENISKELKCDFCFAHVYSSWERGNNENTKCLIRQYFHKTETLEAYQIRS